MSKDNSFNVTLSNDENLHTTRRNLKSTRNIKSGFEFRGYQNREEYHLTPLAGDIQSNIILLNDIPLALTNSLHIPAMDPKLVDASTPIFVVAHSIVYVTIRDFHALAYA